MTRESHLNTNLCVTTVSTLRSLNDSYCSRAQSNISLFSKINQCRVLFFESYGNKFIVTTLDFITPNALLREYSFKQFFLLLCLSFPRAQLSIISHVLHYIQLMIPYHSTHFLRKINQMILLKAFLGSINVKVKSSLF